jgi:hypothetical protein
MSDDLKKLYESISTKFDVGSFDEFSAKMETEDMRKSFYDTVSGKGIDLGDYEEYESRLKKKILQHFKTQFLKRLQRILYWNRNLQLLLRST